LPTFSGLGREYFELAAMRFRSPAEAKAMRKYHVFTAGLFIAQACQARGRSWSSPHGAAACHG